jgi:hypothetical protein
MMARARALSMTTTLTVAVGLLLGASGVLDVLEHPVSQSPVEAWSAPDLPATPRHDADAPAFVPTSDPASRADAAAAPGPTPPTAGAPTTASTPLPPPLMLHIEQLDVTAPVVPVGVLPDGGMAVPDDITTIGWYAVPSRSISPGDAGVAVLAGHRDSRTDGAGALHALATLRPGTRIVIVHADGTTTTWSVDEVTATPRDELPTSRLFARSGAPQLAIVTCGGSFDLLRRSYTHNTIVYASRLEAATVVTPDGAGADGSARGSDSAQASAWPRPHAPARARTTRGA